jgi:hypothetical protein
MLAIGVSVGCKNGSKMRIVLSTSTSNWESLNTCMILRIGSWVTMVPLDLPLRAFCFDNLLKTRGCALFLQSRKK